MISVPDTRQVSRRIRLTGKIQQQLKKEILNQIFFLLLYHDNQAFFSLVQRHGDAGLKYRRENIHDPIHIVKNKDYNKDDKAVMKALYKLKSSQINDLLRANCFTF